MKKVIDKTIWRILRISKIFDYWYNKFLTELLYDLDLREIESEEIKKKYREKLYRLNYESRYSKEVKKLK